MKKMIRLMAVAIVAMAMAACGSSNTPENATKAMLKSFQNGDYKALIEQVYFSKEEVSQEDKDQLAALVQAKVAPEIKKKDGIKDFEVGEAEIAEDGQSAKVPYKIIYGNGSEEAKTQKLVLVDGKWLLDEGK